MTGTIDPEDQAALLWLIRLGIPEIPALRVLLPVATRRSLFVLDDLVRKVDRMSAAAAELGIEVDALKEAGYGEIRRMLAEREIWSPRSGDPGWDQQRDGFGF